MDRSTQEKLMHKAVTDACWDQAAQLSLPPEALLSAAGTQTPAEERLSRLIRTLEAEIIPRLVQVHCPASADAVPAAPDSPGRPTAEDVQDFARLVLADDDLPWMNSLRDWRGRGLSAETIFLDLLAPAARHLGWLWEEDLCDFTEVTVGVGRLQQLMRDLSPAFGREVEYPADGRRVLLTAPAGEQHTFGMSMVAEFFRRAGWEVVGGVGSLDADPALLAQGEWFDVVGISVGHHVRLEWVKATIAAIRQQSRNKGIGVMVGGPLFVVQPLAADEVGADAVAVDGGQAPALAEGLLERRVMRL